MRQSWKTSWQFNRRCGDRVANRVADRVAVRRPTRIAMLRHLFPTKVRLSTSVWEKYGLVRLVFFIVFEFKFGFLFCIFQDIIWIPFPWTNIHRTPVVQNRSFWLQPGAVNSPEKFIAGPEMGLWWSLATSPFSRYSHINGLVFLGNLHRKPMGFYHQI